MTVLTVSNILSGPTIGLTSGIDDLFLLETGGRTVLYAFSRGPSRVLEFDVGATGALTLDGTVQLQGAVAAGEVPALGTVAVSGSTYLSLGGISPSAGQTVSLSGTGQLGTQQQLAGLGTLRAPQYVDIAGTDVLVTGGFGGGMLHYADTGSGYQLNMQLADDSQRYLQDISDSLAFDHQGATFVATASAEENGINLAQVTASGLTQSSVLGATEGLPIDTPMGLTMVQRLNETLIAVASSTTSSVSIVRVESGELVLADHIYDSNVTRFAGANTIAAQTYGDFAFVAVGGAEGGVSLLTLLPGGRAIHLDSIIEDETVPLDQIGALKMHVAGSQLQVYATSTLEAGVARLTYDLSGLGAVVSADGTGATATGTEQDDQIIGSEVGESLSGLAGDDILLDGAGSDTMTGGSGADLFVFAADAVTDTIADFQRATDTMDLSMFDFLYDVSQLTITPTATGATITFRDEVIEVLTTDAAPLTAADLSTSDVLNVDRPPFLFAGRTINGSSDADSLNGGVGGDTITGNAGNDTLAGHGADDSLAGGPGLDVLYGNAGQDTLQGDADADTLVGGSGDDWLDGGDGGDLIYGDDWL